MRFINIIAVLGIVLSLVGCSSPPIQPMSVQQYANIQMRTFQAESENSCPYGVKSGKHENASAMEINYDSRRGQHDHRGYVRREPAIEEWQQHRATAEVVCLSKAEANALKKSKSPETQPTPTQVRGK